MLEDLSNVDLQEALESAIIEGVDTKIAYIKHILSGRDIKPSGPMTKGAQIDFIISETDFEMIANTMTALSWAWWDGKIFTVPDVEKLKITARNMLIAVWDIDDSHQYTEQSTGGFKATRLIYDSIKILSLDFILSGCELSYEDVKNNIDVS